MNELKKMALSASVVFAAATSVFSVDIYSPFHTNFPTSTPQNPPITGDVCAVQFNGTNVVEVASVMGFTSEGDRLAAQEAWAIEKLSLINSNNEFYASNGTVYAKAAWSNAITEWTGTISGGAFSDVDGDSIDPSDSSALNVNVMGTVVDINVFDSTDWEPVFRFIWNVVNWAIFATLLFYCWDYWDQTTIAALLAPQAKGNAQSVFGTNLSGATGLLSAAIITTALLTLPTLMTAVWSNSSVGFFNNPLHGATGGGYSNAVKLGLGMLSRIVPLGTLCASIMNYTFFRISCVTVRGVVCAAIRWCIG